MQQDWLKKQLWVESHAMEEQQEYSYQPLPDEDYGDPIAISEGNLTKKSLSQLKMTQSILNP